MTVEQLRPLPLASSDGYIHTPTSQLVSNGIYSARDHRLTVAITSPAGCGKSSAVNHIMHTDHNARVIVVTPAGRGNRAFLKATAAVFGCYTARDHAHDIEEVLWQQLSEKKEQYLIIDEAQNLDLDAFRSALFLHDETGLPVVFVGNRSTLKRTKIKSAAFEQINDRLFYRVEIEGITRDDAIAFGVSHNVEGSQA